MKLFTKTISPLVGAIVLATGFGFAAGIVGGMLTIKPETGTGAIDSGGAAAIPELVKLGRFLGLKQDLQAQAVVEVVKPTLAGFFRKKAVSQDVANQIYKKADFLGTGFIITNDGWIATTKEVLKNVTQTQAVAVVNQRSYGIEKIVTDSLSELIFVKIKAVNLPVVKLGEPEEVELGQSVLVAGALDKLLVTNIAALAYQPIEKVVKSTESFSEFMLVNNNLAADDLGAVLVNLDGEIIGVGAKNVIIPVNHFEPIIDGMLRSGLIERPELGLNYIDLATALGLEAKLSAGLNRGALVYSAPRPQSPASQAGLQKNDIIIKVDGQLVSARNNLTNLIQSYGPGDLVYLTVLRDGQEFTVEVYLGVR